MKEEQETKKEEVNTATATTTPTSTYEDVEAEKRKTEPNNPKEEVDDMGKYYQSLLEKHHHLFGENPYSPPPFGYQPQPHPFVFQNFSQLAPSCINPVVIGAGIGKITHKLDELNMPSTVKDAVPEIKDRLNKIKEFLIPDINKTTDNTHFNSENVYNFGVTIGELEVYIDTLNESVASNKEVGVLSDIKDFLRKIKECWNGMAGGLGAGLGFSPSFACYNTVNKQPLW